MAKIKMEDGTFEEGTISDLVNRRLNELAEAARTIASVNGNEKKIN